MCFDRTDYIIITIYFVYYWSKILKSKLEFIDGCANFTMFHQTLFSKSGEKLYLYKRPLLTIHLQYDHITLERHFKS